MKAYQLGQGLYRWPVSFEIARPFSNLHANANQQHARGVAALYLEREQLGAWTNDVMSHSSVSTISMGLVVSSPVLLLLLILVGEVFCEHKLVLQDSVKYKIAIFADC